MVSIRTEKMFKIIAFKKYSFEVDGFLFLGGASSGFFPVSCLPSSDQAQVRRHSV